MKGCGICSFIENSLHFQLLYGKAIDFSFCVGDFVKGFV
jgi:hypothetical protein